MKSYKYLLSLFACSSLLSLGTVNAQEATREELLQRIESLSQELEATKAALKGKESMPSDKTAAEYEAKIANAADMGPSKITPGDLFPALEGLEIGGAIRANYFFGDYNDNSPATSADAEGNGAIALDTFRINMDYTRDNWQAKFEYRFYPGYFGNDSYHFLHTGWVGYNFADYDQIQFGVNRVPFGPGAYGISQSWFFDQHYYVGLSDDMDLGIKYTGTSGDLSFDLAYYVSDEGTWSGSSADSARYSYDVVDESGNGYEERNQFNARAVYSIESGDMTIDLGASAQLGFLKSNGPQDDGEHYAASLHPVFKWNNWTLSPQLTYYKYQIDGYLAGDPDGDLIQLGAYDFPTTAATEAWIVGASLSYYYEVSQVDWLDYMIPYVEYSSIMKEAAGFNDSELFVIGSAWARGGWYIYTELATSNGNDFVGNESGFNSRFGANPNDSWESRFNINFGYYF